MHPASAFGRHSVNRPGSGFCEFLTVDISTFSTLVLLIAHTRSMGRLLIAVFVFFPWLRSAMIGTKVIAAHELVV